MLAETLKAKETLRAQLSAIEAKELAGQDLCRQWEKLLERRTKLAGTIQYASDQGAIFESDLQGGTEGILQMIGTHHYNERALMAGATRLESTRLALDHVRRFLEIRKGELAALETELATFAKTHGMEHQP